MINIKPMRFTIGKNDIIFSNEEINIPEGISYLIGENGSGKTVFIKSIMNMFTDNSEKISYDSQSYEDAKNTIRAVFDDSHFLPKLSGIENLKYFNNFSDDKIGLSQIEEFYSLRNKKTDTPFSKYSLGMKKRLAISYALMYDPKFLFMDEPFNGLDIEAKEMLLKVIKNFKEENKTVIISAHDTKEISNICDNILLISNREINFYANVKERISEYLGYYIEVDADSDLSPVKEYILEQYDKDGDRVLLIKDELKDIVLFELQEKGIRIKASRKIEPSFLNIKRCLEEKKDERNFI